MSDRTLVYRFVVVAMVLLVAGCGGDDEVAEAPEAAPELVDAREAALRYLRAEYSDAPAVSLTWAVEAPAGDGPPPPGWMESRFTADDWTVTVGAAVVAPEARRYQVVVANPAVGFDWEGRVSATGWVTEGPEAILSISDIVLAHVEQHYPAAGLSAGLPWTGGRTTPEGLVGQETFEYTAEGWLITISYPVVAPEAVVYQVLAANSAIGFRWEAAIDAARQVTETVTPEGLGPSEVFLDRLGARDLAIEFAARQTNVPPVDPTAWKEERATAEGLVGAETFRYTHSSWVVEVRYPVVAPEQVIYDITITNPNLDIDWHGTVDAQGLVTEGN